MRNEVFFCYSQQDKHWLEEIQKGLQPFLRQTSFLLWDETKIQAGEDWRVEINHALASAKVAVLLVSPDFLASDFIAKQILPPLLEAAKNDGLIILWIAIRKCAYKVTEIERYKAVIDPSTPLKALKGNKRDEALVRICQQIALAANQERRENESERTAGTIVIHVDTPSITIKGEPVANRAKIQQIIEEYFDVNACFIRQKELKALFNSVSDGTRRILEGSPGAGKTALLRQLQNLCLEQNIPAIYIDFSTAEGQLQTTLWRNVMLALTHVDPGIISPDEIEVHLDSEPLESRAVICLDNVDVLASNPHISIEQEMRHLSSLTNWLRTHHESALSIILTIRDAFNVREHASSFSSPWYTGFLISPLAGLSESRAIHLLHLACITDTTQIAFCVNKARHRFPLDLLLLAYLLKEYATSNSADYELIEKRYLQVEPLLRQ